MTDLIGKTARAMIEDLAAKRVSARELLDAHVARCDGVNPQLNAVVATDLDRARNEAKAIDDKRARGEPLGALAGIPMTVKDCYDVDGLPATAGAPVFANRPKQCADAKLVRAVRDAGAIVWGKTNVPLMAGDFQSYNEVYGTTNNPYDLTRTPGGSSGGAAAALAARITPLEIGSDIGGSLRHPANFCGVTALKPTWGRLPLRGHVPPPPGYNGEPDLGVGGPMARNIGDLRLLFEVMTGTASPARPVKGARIALWTDDPEFPLAADVRATVEKAGDALKQQGAIVERIDAPLDAKKLMDSYFALLAPIISSGFPDEVYNMLSAMRPGCVEAVRGGADRYSSAGYIVASTPSYREFAQAAVQRQFLKDQLEGFFADGWDAILSPVTTIPAFPHNQDGQLSDRTLECDNQRIAYLHALDWIALATSMHTPAVAVSAGRTATGLPIGVQLITKWDDEASALNLAEALESAIGPLPQPIL